MASFGLAMVQGQKNAQDLAKGQLDTMASMAKSAAEAEKMGEYFDPTNAALREYALQEKDSQLEKLNTFKAFAPGMATDPVGTAPAVLGASLGGEWTVAKTPDGKYAAQEWITDANGVLKLGPRSFETTSANQLADVVNRTATATTSDILAKTTSLADAERATGQKMAFEEFKDKSLAKYIKNPELQNKMDIARLQDAGDTRRTGMTASVALQGHNLDYQKTVSSAYIGLQEKDKELAKRLNDSLSWEFGGITRDTEGNITTVGGQPIETINPDLRLKIRNRSDELLGAAVTMRKLGGSSLEGTPETVRAVKTAQTKAEAAKGLPSKSESAPAQEKAGMPTPQQILEAKKAERFAKAARAQELEDYNRMRDAQESGSRPRFY